MVFRNKYSQILINKFPNFAKSESLRKAVDIFSEDELISTCALFTGLAKYLTRELVPKYTTISQEEIDIYQYVELIRIQYHHFPDESDEGDYDGAACVCFLESLINMASWDRGFTYDRFIPYLGEKSKEFCRTWDEFTGVQSPGLW